MKKAVIIISIVAVFILSSCVYAIDKTQPRVDYQETEVQYEIISAREYSLNVPEGEGAIKKDYVDDPVTAKIIGDAVIKSIVGEEEFNSFSSVSIWYDEENGIWLVNRNLGPDTLGGDISCFIRRSSGEILNVIAGE